MRQIAAFAGAVRKPIAMVGDWNMTPQELCDTGFLMSFMPFRKLEVSAPDASFTCTSGAGRVLDYWLLDQQASAVLTRPSLIEEAT